MTNTEPISVRDFLRNFANIAQGTVEKRYIIMRHGKPIGIFTSWELVKKAMAKQKIQKTHQTWLDELRKFEQSVAIDE